LEDEIAFNYDFFANYNGSNEARFYDYVRDIQVRTTNPGRLLENTQAYPSDENSQEAFQYGGTTGADLIYYTGADYADISNNEKLNHIQTDQYERIFKEFTRIKYDTPDERYPGIMRFQTQINRSLIGDGTGSMLDDTRKFTITKRQLLEAYNLPVENNTQLPGKIIIYFQLHLSTTFQWTQVGDIDANSNNIYGDDNDKLGVLLAAGYSNPNVRPYYWGGYVYTEEWIGGNPEGTYKMDGGSGYYPGSKGHSYVYIEGLGKYTLPIPNVAKPGGRIEGFKYEDFTENDQTYDTSKPLNDWAIYASTAISDIGISRFACITGDDNLGLADGQYVFNDLPLNLVWQIAEKQESTYTQTYPNTNTPKEDGGSGTDYWYKQKLQIQVSGLGSYAWNIQLSPIMMTMQNINFANMKRTAKLVILKSTNEISKASDPVNYTVTLRNEGNIALTLDRIEEKYGNMTSPVVYANYNDPNGFPQTLAPGETVTVNYSITIPVDYQNSADTFTNTITAYYTSAVGNVTESSTATVKLFRPAIDVQKTANHEYAQNGDNIIYTITITNNSTSASLTQAEIPADHVTSITDTLINNIVFYDVNNNIVSLPIDILAGQSRVLHYYYTIDANNYAAEKVGVYKVVNNTVTVNANPVNFPNLLSDNASFQIKILEPNFTIVKEVYKNAEQANSSTPVPELQLACPKAKVTYKYIITNTGNTPLYINSITDDKLTSIDLNALAAAKGLNVLDVGESGYFLVVDWVIPVDTPTNIEYKNTVTAKYDMNFADPNGTNDTKSLTATDYATLNLFNPSIKVIKIGYAAKPNGEVDYQITIKNMTTVDNTALNLADMPAMHYVLEDEKLLNGVVMTGDLSCVDDPLTPLDDTEITYSFPMTKITKVSPFSNKATIDAYPVGFEEVLFFLFF
jgi:uncharacterized repeat protein (TIGR01451 family)